MADPITILGIAGSLRKDSYNKAALRAAQQLCPAGTKLEIYDITGLPLFNQDEERNPNPKVTDFKQRIRAADAILISTPEYNYSIPGVLKNALDYLLPEYRRKPIGIATVSGGGFGGLNCLAQLRLVTLGMGAFPIPAAFPVSKVQDSFAEDGTPKDPMLEKRAQAFVGEMLWFTEAIAAQKARG